MGIERARVLEVHAPGAPVRSGYLVDHRLVLTSGTGAAEVRPAGTATWLPAALLWSSAGVALLELDDPSALMMPPDRAPWGRVAGRRPVAVTAMGFPPAPSRPQWPRDPERFFGHVVPGGPAALAVTGPRPAGDGMAGAALFAGAELVGVLLPGGGAVPVGALAADAAFAGLVGEVALVEVTAPATGLSIL